MKKAPQAGLVPICTAVPKCFHPNMKYLCLLCPGTSRKETNSLMDHQEPTVFMTWSGDCWAVNCNPT